MSDTIFNRKRYLQLEKSPIIYFVTLLLVVSIGYFAFSGIFNNSWFFDDAPNFSWMSSISSLDDLLFALSNGIAGPGGRPISNASFLLNLSDWLSNNPAGFRRINMLIHICNSFLVFLLCMKLFGYFTESNVKINRCSLLAALIWFLTPLHFTTILMPVQRMTILSGFFTLSGMLAYLYGRNLIERGRVISGLGTVAICLPVFSLLGLFSKENGALLPFFVFALEILIPKGGQGVFSSKLWTTFKVSLIAGPMALLWIYFYLSWEGVTEGYALRPFSMSERLATQSIVLLDYIKLFFIPNILKFGPFNDDYPIYRFNQVLPYFALILWLVFLVVSMSLKIKHKSPLLLFALCWFLCGHLLESTFVPLEIYFEHRNYIPILGPLIALVVLSLQCERVKYAPLIILLMISFSSWRVISLWSRPILAAELMVQYSPSSVRAATYLAVLHEAQDTKRSFRVLNLASKRIPDSASLGFSMLELSCGMHAEIEERSYLSVKNNIQGYRLDYLEAVTTSLEGIYALLKENDCFWLDLPKFLVLLQGLTESSIHKENREAAYRLYFLKYSVLLELDKAEEALKELKLAQKYRSEPGNVIKISMLLLHLGRPSESVEYLEQQYEMINWQSQKNAVYWNHQLKQTLGLICKASPVACKNYQTESAINL